MEPTIEPGKPEEAAHARSEIAPDGEAVVLLAPMAAKRAETAIFLADRVESAGGGRLTRAPLSPPENHAVSVPGEKERCPVRAAKPKRSYQRLASGILRSQVNHPSIAGQRLNLTARSPGHLYELKRHVDELARDFRFGRKTAQQVDRQLRGIVHGPLGVKVAWDAWYAAVSPHAQAKARSTWTHMFADALSEHTLLVEIDGGVLDDWQAAMIRKAYAPKTIRSAYWLLAAAARRAIRSRLLDALPWGDWRPKKGGVVRRPEAACSVAELEAIVSVCLLEDAARWSRGRYADLANRAIVIALVGLRQGEAAALGWDHIDLERGEVDIEFQALDSWRVHWPHKTRPTFVVKNKRGHRQLLHPSALEALRSQKAHLEKWGLYRDDGPVFPGRKGAWRSNANTIKPEKMKLIAKAAGVPNAERWVVHSLRHSFASLEVKSGSDLRSAQQRTGHASMRQLEEYVHAARELPASSIPALTMDALRAVVAHAQAIGDVTIAERAGQAKGRADAAIAEAERSIEKIREERARGPRVFFGTQTTKPKEGEK